MTMDIIPSPQTSIGELANQYAAATVFSDYHERTSANTLRRQRADLALFSRYLALVGITITAKSLLDDPSAWSPITHGLVDGWIRWQLKEGYAIGSINVHLSTVKKYCSLAARAGALPVADVGAIKLVQGYRHKEGRNVDATRNITRVGNKKAEAVLISKEQAKQLKQQPDTPQGRRDALLVCLLIDHGLRCGEIADLPANALDLDENILTFYRKKVDKVQKHALTHDTREAARHYLTIAQPGAFLLMGSRKGGRLEGRMSERAITARMELLCETIGIEGASAHDGRHAWATMAVKGGTDLKSLQDAGGWASIAMPARYAASNNIANEGVNLG